MLGVLGGWLKKIKSHSATVGLIALVVLVGLFLFHLGSAPAGLSSQESAYHQSIAPISRIFDNAVYAPHKILAWGFEHINSSNLELMRLPSIIFGAIFTISFYFLARGLFGKTVGLLSTAVFSLTPLFIVASRQSSADILLFAPVTLMAAYSWLTKTEDHRILAWLLLLFSAAIFAYVPGVFIWLIGAAIMTRRKISLVLEDMPNWAIVAAFWIFAIIIIPAVFSIAKDWHTLKAFVPLPAHFGVIVNILKQIGWMSLSLVFKTPYHDQLIVGRVPLLDIIQVALVAFGSYALLTAARAKAFALFSSVVFSILLAGLNNNLRLLALGLPALAVFAAAGLRYLYIEWRGIFPRNPIPKTLALLLMVAVVSVQSIYGLSYGLVAWPHAETTKHDYVLK